VLEDEDRDRRPEPLHVLGVRCAELDRNVRAPGLVLCKQR
jgi:hypothetical protein